MFFKKADIKCENCKHAYTYFRQITNDKGLPDFEKLLRCRLENKIKEDGTPEIRNCFEQR